MQRYEEKLKYQCIIVTKWNGAVLNLLDITF